MKFIIVFVALFAVALAAPPSSETTVLRSDSNVGPESYNYALETSDGTSKQEEGQLKNVGTEQEAIAVRGSFTWVDPEGQSHTINYVADETGYHAEGADVPVAPQA